MKSVHSRRVVALLGAASLLSHSFAWAADAPSAAPTPPPAAAPAAPAPPEPKKVDAATKTEAAQRFDRAIRLFDGGDNAGALAEFKRTYEILPNPVVLYNIGLVYAAMGRPVDAVDALEPAIASNSLSKTQLERAKATLSDQKARVGRLMVTTLPEGARVEIDNVEVAKTPLTGPIRVSEGNHIVGAVAEGYAPARKEVVIAGNADASVALELVQTQGKQLANLTVRSRTAAAEVLVDGQPVGKTPLATSVTLVAGHHVVELRRPGYVTERREVTVGQGATGDLTVDLRVDEAALGSAGGTLVLDTSEGPAELTLDGERRGVYTGPLRIPAGPHRISVSSAGFFTTDRDVLLEQGKPTVVEVRFEPTPETRKSYRSSAMFHRTWGLVGVIAGPLIAAGGFGVTRVAASNEDDGKDALAAATLLNTNNEAPCDWRNGYDSQDGSDQPCRKLFNDANDDIDGAKNMRLAGYITMGVGGAIAVTGVILLLTGNDPNKYERTAEPARARSKGPQFSLVPGPGQVGTGLRVTF